MFAFAWHNLFSIDIKYGTYFDLGMIFPRIFIVSLFGTKIDAGWIWNPRCLWSECSGDPIRGDGLSSFDDWSGSKYYSTEVYYTCNEGVGFNINNAPAKISGQCGQKCEEGRYSWAHNTKPNQPNGRCKYNQGQCNPSWHYSFTPEGGGLPECSIGDQKCSKPKYHLFLAAACDKDKLPSVGQSSKDYSSSELVPGATATIKCNTGYEFKGNLAATSTEMPDLPPWQREPVECKSSNFEIEIAFLPLSNSR